LNALGRVVIRLTTRLLRLTLRTLRITIEEPDRSAISPSDYRFGRAIYAIQERDLFCVAALARFARFHTLIASGRDGDWASIVAEGLGCRVIRGSSRHDPTAAGMSLVRALRGSQDPAVLVVDGPIGPAGVAKDGIGVLSRLTGRPVVVACATASPALVVKKSWSQMRIPWPWARIRIVTSDVLRVSAEDDRSQSRQLAKRVSEHFARLDARELPLPSSKESVVAR
jgi:lysophospholipid acyltransferase (LPLAT)-like uncharacterized protein